MPGVRCLRADVRSGNAARRGDGYWRITRKGCMMPNEIPPSIKGYLIERHVDRWWRIIDQLQRSLDTNDQELGAALVRMVRDALKQRAVHEDRMVMMTHRKDDEQRILSAEAQLPS